MKLMWGLFLFIFMSCAVPQKSIKNEIKTDENSAEHKLVEARITLSKGDFQGAVNLYLEIYQNDKYNPIFREESLFNIGMMYSDAAESIRDYEIALKYLRKLSSEFPKTQFKEKTNRQIRYIRNQIKRLKQQ